MVQMGPLPRAGSAPRCLKIQGSPNPTTAETVPPPTTASPTANDRAMSLKKKNTARNVIVPSVIPIPTPVISSSHRSLPIEILSVDRPRTATDTAWVPIACRTPSTRRLKDRICWRSTTARTNTSCVSRRASSLRPKGSGRSPCTTTSTSSSRTPSTVRT